MHSFEASVQLVPTFHSHPVCTLLELQLILESEEDCVQLGPQLSLKKETAQLAISKYFV